MSDCLSKSKIYLLSIHMVFFIFYRKRGGMSDIFRQRREQLASCLKNGLLFLPNAGEKYRNFHISYPYRHDSDFYYLSGFSEPSSLLCLIVLNGIIKESFLFCLPKNHEEELWAGERLGLERAKKEFDFDHVLPYSCVWEKVKSLLKGSVHLYSSFGLNAHLDQILYDYQKESYFCPLYDGPVVLEDVRHHLGRQRFVKDPTEIECIRQAVHITEKAHCQAAKKIKPGLWEYEVEAELMHAFYAHGSRFPAYGNIVASGDRACILHYTENNRRMQEGELLLIDSGCEYKGYASDVTRTYPVSGHYEGLPKELYELVLAAQKEAIESVCHGQEMYQVHLCAVRVLSQGLIDLGVLQGSCEEVMEKGLYKKYYMHRTGHSMGADVHDTGLIDVGLRPNILLSGAVITVEPGLYFWPSDELDSRFWGIGIRIEDDVLVTESGYDVLTKAIPKLCTDVEEMMR